MNAEAIFEAVDKELWGVWFLIGAALVFFMQCGFAMVETGFTRAKNAGNIIMKNLMDFCIGTVVFILIGFGLFLGEDMVGLIGKPGLDIFTAYENFDYSNFVFNLVFCATAATIVSGAMAERTKFLSYCVYSGVISALIYPVEAHWIWGGGWLAQLGFHDFAGSTAIHMVGGLSALIGAKILGPRIGKFETDKDGKVTKVNAIPGHSLTLGALGVFILWFGWYGFNGAAAKSIDQLGSVFMATTIAPAIATVTCMVFTWLKYGKPDVSMCLNASLAGLVGVTAPCDVVDCLGASIIGIVSGLLVAFGVWLLDYKLHIDDPVGAVAVHFCNGIWGTVAVGLFANPKVPGYSLANADGKQLAGVFYGGGFELFGYQLLGMVAVLAWTGVTITLTFYAIKKTIGLRASRHEEIVGLDSTEHGLASSYADFIPTTHIETTASGKEQEVANVIPAAPVEKSVPVEHKKSVSIASDAGVKMTKVDIITNIERFDALKNALYDIGITGMTVTNAMGCGMQKGAAEYYRGVPVEARLLPKVKVEVVVCRIPVETVVETVKQALYTGKIGDGKIFVYDVENVLKVRTGESGYDALQDD
ncbi:ammonium transporter [Ruminococcus champanellensis]|uniref:ammonium transporter n=1 Tax=Ruminococcus champanellensis TaxID=1161942 RepID=UPI00248C39FE|nr:ammonium transporter [Ruminococcus champanellensis]